MKVAELIEALKQLPPEREVLVGAPAHNRWRHVRACAIDEVREDSVTWSEYLQSLKVEPEPEERSGRDEDEDEDDVESQDVVLITIIENG